jgi:hypothetical protein
MSDKFAAGDWVQVKGRPEAVCRVLYFIPGNRFVGVSFGGNRTSADSYELEPVSREVSVALTLKYGNDEVYPTIVDDKTAQVLQGPSGQVGPVGVNGPMGVGA